LLGMTDVIFRAAPVAAATNLDHVRCYLSW